MKQNKYVIGEMQPTTGGLDVEIKHRMVPPNVTITSVELGIRDLVESEIAAALARIEESARELALGSVDAITLSGMPPIVSRGYGFDKVVIERIQKVTSVPATTAPTSAVEAMKVLGAKKIILVTPYGDRINGMVVRFFQDSGFEIGTLQTANVSFDQYNKLPRSLSYELSLEGKTQAPDAGCIYIPCSGWAVSENIERIEKETGLPVVGGTQSVVWGALRLIGIRTPVPGFGRLLSRY